MFLVQRERQDFWEKAQQCTCAQPLVSRTMGKVGTWSFSSLRYFLKPSAWFNDVLGPALQSEKFTKYGLQWEDHWPHKDAVFCGGPTACTEEVFPSDRAEMIFGQKICHRKYQNVSLSNAFSGGSCRLRAPTAHWFLGTLFERNWNLHVDEDKLGPGTAWKFSRASRPSLLTVCSRPRHGECRIRGLHPLSAGGEEFLLLIIWAGY